MLLHRLLHRPATAYQARFLAGLEARPLDAAIASSGQGRAVRVLLVGSGITTGWGVHTHGLALVGALQRALQLRLQRPVDVEQVSSVGATLDGLPDLLGDAAAQHWDAVVLAAGFTDAVQLTPPARWEAALGRMLAKLDADMPRGLPVPVVVAGIPPLDFLRPAWPLTALMRAHAETLNGLTRRAVSRHRRLWFAPLPGMANREGRPTGSPEAYAAWAEALARRIAPRVPAEQERIGDVRLSAGPIEPAVARLLGEDGAGALSALQAVAARAQQRLDSDLVVVGLVSGDRMWNLADSANGPVRAVELASTFCATTLRDGALHLPDTAADPRFRDVHRTWDAAVTAYAGAVIRDDEGRAVGTVCSFNGGTVEAVAPAVLRAAAEEVRRVLTDPPPAPTHRPAASPRVLDPEGMPSRFEPTPGTRARLRRDAPRLAAIAEERAVPVGPDARALGPDPLRVLVVGGDYAVGFGAPTRQDAVDGSLARLLHTRTGRGVVMVNRAQHGVRLERLAESLGDDGAHSFDLVVWAPTFLEGARLRLRRPWTRGIDGMLRRIGTTSEAAVVLIGFPRLLGSQPLAVLGRARAARINRLLQSTVRRHPRVSLVEPPPIPLGEVDRLDGPAVYAGVALAVLPSAMDLLEPHGTDRLADVGLAAREPVPAS